MAKIERKSISDMLAAKPTRKPSVTEIDKITDEIHSPTSLEAAPNRAAASAEGKVKRISLIAPMTLYIKAKTKATIQEESLMAYIIRLIEEDVKN